MAWDKFEKLTELLKRRITDIVMYKLKDPRIGFITITRIDLAKDLKWCKVYYTVYGSQGDLTKTACALTDARGFIQSEAAKTLHTRTMPRLEFLRDESLDGMDRVNQIFDTLAAEREEKECSESIPEDRDEEGNHLDA
jgi:ribosome-binding factor A